MKRQNAFKEEHPVIQFAYFTAVILTTMFVNHPVILAVSFVGAVSYYLLLNGWHRMAGMQFLYAALLFLIVILINTLFNHYGVTPLFYLKTGAVTLEAVVYGVVLASMLWISLIWFSNVNQVLTTDRILYLAGRLTPSLSLVISMVFRFVPRFQRQLAVIRESQMCLGRDMKGQNLINKVRLACSEFSMLVTWSLENGVDTADSMRARGYGVGKRTAYAVFLLHRRDVVSGMILFILYGISLYGFCSGLAYAAYNPVIQINGMTFTEKSLVVYGAWLAFCSFPALLSLWERVQWRHLEKWRI